MARLLFASVTLVSVAAACGGSEDRSWSRVEASPPAVTSAPDAGAPRPASPALPRPSYGSTVSLEDTPPSISGGTLLMARDGVHVVAADPDRDRVFIVNLDSRVVEHEIALERNDEPGRIAEDANGRFHVVLRRGGAVLSIGIAGGTVTRSRRRVCSAPRGIAYQPTGKVILVACERGELMTLGAAPDANPPTLVATLSSDLRDVVVTRTRTYVSTFRSAQIYELTPENVQLGSSRLPAQPPGAGTPMVAFRMAAAGPPEADAPPIVVHEQARPGPIASGPGSYGAASGACTGGSVVTSAVSQLGPGGTTSLLPISAVLAVDVAIDGVNLAVVAAGNGHTRELPQLYRVTAEADATSPCARVQSTKAGAGLGQLTAVASRPRGALVVQSREPATLTLFPEGTVIPLSSVSREDTGHAVFHSNAGSGVACASCHPEGGDDGQVWDFDGVGRRRTQSLRGTLAGTAPFHWSGNVPDIGHIADGALTARMSGPELDTPQKQALERWIFGIPAPRPRDSGALDVQQRGWSVFNRADVGCLLCHDGPKLTNNANADIGTGGSFPVPSLIGVTARPPFLHDGCANTLRDTLGATCRATKHGSTEHLSASEVDDLVAYLEAL